ncbi:ergothioneine biosynthesis glutamate--cysteine ligase EgtA [Salinactinospora qingdaonensis]|uniref:Glutamate--cysteine ligase EgtA n=1 Tax=Salinactinospora qingdaonensis TaxID=702744 RepID=A0ABP7EV04_9ACTN
MEHLTKADVYNYVNGICFKTGPPGRVGAETEWLIVDPARPRAPVPLERLTALVDDAGPLPAGSTVTYEPGGQLELSSLPCQGPAAVATALSADLEHITACLNDAGLRLHGNGLDPYRSPERQLTLPRYAVMERYFDSASPTGRTMMCSTASLQVCLDIGADTADAARRWRLAHRLGPLFVAAFANSPLWRGRPTGWSSTRWAVWSAIDASRTRAPTCDDPDGPAADWLRYALRARLMTIRRDTAPWIVDPGLRFGDWLVNGHPQRPTIDDFAYHLTTLFPPVRPRGWLELRMIDALPQQWCSVPIAVAAALIDDPVAADIAYAETERLCSGGVPGRDVWLAAARHALAVPTIAESTRACFAAAAAALPRLGAADLVAAVDDYRARFVEQGRCPADEQLGDL